MVGRLSAELGIYKRKSKILKLVFFMDDILVEISLFFSLVESVFSFFSSLNLSFINSDLSVCHNFLKGWEVLNNNTHMVLSEHLFTTLCPAIEGIFLPETR